MRKKFIVGLCVLFAAVLLFPITDHLRDGGTVEYKAVLYNVQKVHRLKPDLGSEKDHPQGTLVELSEQDYLKGTVVEILGFEVFNNVE